MIDIQSSAQGAELRRAKRDKISNEGEEYKNATFAHVTQLIKFVVARKRPDLIIRFPCKQLAKIFNWNKRTLFT